MAKDPPASFAGLFGEAVLRHFVLTGGACKPRDAAKLMGRSLSSVKRSLAGLSDEDNAILLECTARVPNPHRRGEVYFPSRQALRRELLKHLGPRPS